MLNINLLRNFLVSALVALLVLFLLPLVVQEQGSSFSGVQLFQAYLIVAILNFIATSLVSYLNFKAKPKAARAQVAAPSSVSSVPREDGSVKWFNVSKGYGFIIRDQGGEVFVHFRSILGGGHRTLREGQRVTFISVEGEKGLQAEEVMTEGH